MPESDDFASELRGDVNIAQSGGNGDDKKLVWWIMGIVAAAVVAGVMSICSALFTMNGRLSSLEAKVDLLVAERPPRHRGSADADRE